MIKALLVIDNPNICVDCVRFPLCSLEYAIIYGKELKAKTKPIKEICRLKQIPKKKELSEEVPSVAFINGKSVDNYALGWNDCIDEILGEDYE